EALRSARDVIAEFAVCHVLAEELERRLGPEARDCRVNHVNERARRQGDLVGNSGRVGIQPGFVVVRTHTSPRVGTMFPTPPEAMERVMRRSTPSPVTGRRTGRC